MSTEKIINRNEVKPEDSWDLSKLFATEEAWEKELKKFSDQIPKAEEFKGKLGNSKNTLKEFLDFMYRHELSGERLGYYAFLRLSEDGGDSSRQDRYGRLMRAATESETALSFFAPEIQSIPDETMAEYLSSPELAEYKIVLEKLLHYKPHILSEAEENLLAMQAEANQTAQKAFAALNDVDLSFGEIDTKDGKKPLTHGSYAAFLLDPDREVRKKACEQFMFRYKDHENTIAALYAGSIQLDVYKAKIRKYPSSIEAKLFPDKVPLSVYDNLIHTVTNNLDPLHHYYDIRKKALGLETLYIYDSKVPLVKDIKVEHSYEEAVNVVLSALAPLGKEYTSTLKQGLTKGWVDKYENKGKRSGAFSAGSYIGDPYILMNYKSDVLRDVFTLAHEAGHSMHSWYSVRSNPFQHYQYTIFEAEVASTFNEQLLLHYLMEQVDSKEMELYLINKHIDDIIGTLFRQTMFAEYEKISHQLVEDGQTLTVAVLREEYRKLLLKYFGESIGLLENDDLEGLRIPHFYRSFYVYKYSTGIAASITLAEKVLNGDETDREAYFNFLKSGGSKYPLESLKAAGVDMSSPEPVKKALAVFKERVKQLEGLLLTT